MDNPIFMIIIIFLIILVAREIMCWYWRIHERVNNQEKQIELLEKILFQLNEINIKIDPDIEIVYEEETDHKESTP